MHRMKQRTCLDDRVGVAQKRVLAAVAVLLLSEADSALGPVLVALLRHAGRVALPTVIDEDGGILDGTVGAVQTLIAGTENRAGDGIVTRLEKLEVSGAVAASALGLSRDGLATVARALLVLPVEVEPGHIAVAHTAKITLVGAAPLAARIQEASDVARREVGPDAGAVLLAI
jgi:hypothetical protein